MRTGQAHRVGQEESWGTDHVRRHLLPPQGLLLTCKQAEQKGEKSHQLTWKCYTDGSDVLVPSHPGKAINCGMSNRA